MVLPTSLPQAGGADEPQDVQQNANSSSRSIAPMTDDGGKKKPFKEVLDKKLLEKDAKQPLPVASNNVDEDGKMSPLDLAAQTLVRDAKPKPSLSDAAVFFKDDATQTLSNKSLLANVGDEGLEPAANTLTPIANPEVVDTETIALPKEVLKSDIEAIKSAVAMLKSDKVATKGNVDVIKSDVAAIKNAVDVLKSDVSIDVKPDVAVETKPKVVAKVKQEAVVSAKDDELVEKTPEVPVGIKPDVAPALKSDLADDVKPKVSADIKPDDALDVKPDVSLGIKPKVPLGAKVDRPIDSKPEVAVSIKPDLPVVTKPLEKSDDDLADVGEKTPVVTTTVDEKPKAKGATKGKEEKVSDEASDEASIAPTGDLDKESKGKKAEDAVNVPTVNLPPGPHVVAQVAAPVETKLVQDTKKVREVLVQLAQQMLEKVEQIVTPDRTDTTLTLQYPPLFSGVGVQITEFSTAPKQFNITFTNLNNPEARLLIEMPKNQTQLQQMLIDKGYTLQTITIEQKIPGLSSTETGGVKLGQRGQSGTQADAQTDEDEGNVT